MISIIIYKVLFWLEFIRTIFNKKWQRISFFGFLVFEVFNTIILFYSTRGIGKMDIINIFVEWWWSLRNKGHYHWFMSLKSWAHWQFCLSFGKTIFVKKKKLPKRSSYYNKQVIFFFHLYFLGFWKYLFGFLGFW